MASFLKKKGEQLCLLIIICLIIPGCMRYVVLEEEWPWTEDSFLPTGGGILVARAKVRSYEQSVCESKSIAIANEKLDILVEKILESFRKEWIRDSLYNRYQAGYGKFIAAVKSGSREKYELYDLIGEEKQKTEECIATSSLKLKSLVEVIEKYSPPDSVFQAGILKSRFHQRLKSQVEKSAG